MVALVIALGVISGVAGAISLAVACWIWATPRKELLALDLDPDAVLNDLNGPLAVGMDLQEA
jgi:hypothetical protein